MTACPTGELNKVFKGGAMGERRRKRIYKKLFYNFPIVILCRQDIFDRFLLKHRIMPNRLVLNYIDWVLYHEKNRAFHESHNLWKAPDTYYKKSDLSKARLTVKAHNGLVYTNDIFRKMYPDVCFVAVVRNGFAVCEGLIRRGWDLDKAAELYKKIGNEIARNIPNPDYMFIKFEDIIINPLAAISKIYDHCGLDQKGLRYFRLQHKPIISKNGSKVLMGKYERQVVWYKADEIVSHFDPEINKNQIARLGKDKKKYLKEIIGKTMEKLGYL
jgi:hypothetical protein